MIETKWWIKLIQLILENIVFLCKTNVIFTFSHQNHIHTGLATQRERNMTTIKIVTDLPAWLHLETAIHFQGTEHFDKYTGTWQMCCGLRIIKAVLAFSPENLFVCFRAQQCKLVSAFCKATNCLSFKVYPQRVLSSQCYMAQIFPPSYKRAAKAFHWEECCGRYCSSTACIHKCVPANLSQSTADWLRNL